MAPTAWSTQRQAVCYASLLPTRPSVSKCSDLHLIYYLSTKCSFHGTRRLVNAATGCLLRLPPTHSSFSERVFRLAPDLLPVH